MADPFKYIRRLTIALMLSGALNMAFFALILHWTIYELPSVSYYPHKPILVNNSIDPPSFNQNKEIYMALKKGDKASQSLLDAFFMTKEFQAMEGLLNQGNFKIDRLKLLELSLQGDWDSLSAFYEEQKMSCDISSERRQQFLLDYIDKNSKAAAHLMLITDDDFAIAKTKDASALKILQLLQEASPEAENFAQEMLRSSRLDEVKKLAAKRLFQYVGESVSDDKLLTAAFSRFNVETAVEKTNSVLSIGDVKSSSVAYNKKIESISEKNSISGVAKQQEILSKGISSINTPQVPPAQFFAETKPQAKPVVPSKECAFSQSSPSSSAYPITPAPKRRVIPSVIASRPKEYVVQNGDTLWKIAQKHQIDIRYLRAFNRLEEDAVQPGRTIKIP